MSSLIVKGNLKLITQSRYDMRDFYPKPKEELKDVPEYMGPVEIQEAIDERGRRMVALEDIPKYAIIMVSKALALETRGNEELVKMVEEKLKEDPTRGPALFKLYAGKKLGHIPYYPVSSNTIIDISRKAKEEELTFPLSEKERERIRKIIQYNAWEDEDKNLGLWILPSYFNHNCIDFNCVTQAFGEYRFVRTTKKIQKNEELLISYVGGFETYGEREGILQDHGFMCICRLCLHERSYLFYEEQKEEILFDHKEEWDFTEFDEQGLQEVFSRVQEDILNFEGIVNRCGRPEFKFSMERLVHKVFDILGELGRTEEQLEGGEKYYKVLNGCPSLGGGDPIVLRVHAAYFPASVSLKMKDWEGLTKWIDMLRKDVKQVFGDIFETVYPEFDKEALHSIPGYIP